MKTASVIPFAAALITGLLLRQAPAMSTPPPGGEIRLTGALSSRCIPLRGGGVYLQMAVDTRGCPLPERVYRPMNIAVVLDRSGSMSEEHKMEFARKAVLTLIDRLSSEDCLSIVIYDNVIQTLVPMQPVRDRIALRRLILEVYPRGTTNLGGGMQEGFRQIESQLGREHVNRVILLSDGLANEGTTDPGELERIADRYRRMSVSLSTIGVGLDYNEDLMLGLARHGGGNYYFVERPNQLAAIFDRELSGLSTLVVQNARIEVTLGDGIAITDVIGCEWNQAGRKVVIPLGDLYANGVREYTLELAIPPGSGTRHVASGVLLAGNGWPLSSCPPEFSVDIRHTDAYADLRGGKNWDAQARAEIAVSTRSVDRAMKSLDEGRKDEADRELGRAAAALQSSEALANSPLCTPAVRDQIQQLQTFSRAVQSGDDLRRVKKSIQYDNYKTRKK